ncbi:membrane-associated protein, putative [Bodo saltans]|uniref:Membrane-associated protein, putative n=1 Tax=Bodo saltans TaxID=75058 RepID=A0A0S4IVR7_BODSA|nr:membrane-associated protein, putative [Bodo saltans]|eukprot:CUG03346.1 membrane-associated protein, putative [Bodo saltans]
MTMTTIATPTPTVTATALMTTTPAATTMIATSSFPLGVFITLKTQSVMPLKTERRWRRALQICNRIFPKRTVQTAGGMLIFPLNTSSKCMTWETATTLPRTTALYSAMNKQGFSGSLCWLLGTTQGAFGTQRTIPMFAENRPSSSGFGTLNYFFFVFFFLSVTFSLTTGFDSPPVFHVFFFFFSSSCSTRVISHSPCAVECTQEWRRIIQVPRVASILSYAKQRGYSNPH